MTEASHLKHQAAALNRPAQRQPPRRAGSIRRTSSLQTLWSQGNSDTYRIIGRSRDLATPLESDPQMIGEDVIEATLGADRRLIALDGSRLSDRLARFAGLNVGGELRSAMAHDLADEVRGETRLHRLLDDLAGASFMSVAAWYAWEGGIPGHAARANVLDPTLRPVEGVCLSYVPGSPSMTDDGFGIEDNADHPLGPHPLGNDDPLGFHVLAEHEGPNQWRLRRTDLWCEDGDLVIDAWFQDSSAIHGDPSQRVIFHEYGLVARADPETLELKAITVAPHVLPYITCHAAPTTARTLIGRSLRELRSQVPIILKGSAGCTHLNDMLRALQDVAGLTGDLGSTVLIAS